MIEVDLLIFDLDGTLVNSLGDIERSANHTMRTMGLSALSQAGIRSFVGDGIQMLLRRCLETQVTVSSETLDKAYLIYTNHHDQHCLDTTVVYPGVVEILDCYASKKKAIVTNKSHRYTRRVIDGLGIGKRFDLVVGGDSLAFRKPDPRVIRHVLHDLQALPSRSVMIGDGPQDILAGAGANVHTCGVTYGFRDRSELRSAEFIVDDIRDLEGIIA